MLFLSRRSPPLFVQHLYVLVISLLIIVCNIYAKCSIDHWLRKNSVLTGFHSVFAENLSVITNRFRYTV